MASNELLGASGRQTGLLFRKQALNRLRLWTLLLTNFDWYNKWCNLKRFDWSVQGCDLYHEN